jgi:hypothetical protein
MSSDGSFLKIRHWFSDFQEIDIVRLPERIATGAVSVENP